MKLQINAEIDGVEVLKEYVIPSFEKAGVPVQTSDSVKVQVWSEKSQKFIDFNPEQIKFIFSK